MEHTYSVAYCTFHVTFKASNRTWKGNLINENDGADVRHIAAWPFFPCNCEYCSRWFLFADFICLISKKINLLVYAC